MVICYIFHLVCELKIIILPPLKSFQWVGWEVGGCIWIYNISSWAFQSWIHSFEHQRRAGAKLDNHWSDQMSKFFRWYFKIIFIHLLYHDTLKFSVNFDCIMIQWVSISKMKEAWNGSILLHLSCLYHFGYVHWMYHDTFKLWICIECIMIQSRVKPEILSSNCVLIRKPRSVQICTIMPLDLMPSNVH